MLRGDFQSELLPSLEIKILQMLRMHRAQPEEQKKVEKQVEEHLECIHVGQQRPWRLAFERFSLPS